MKHILIETVYGTMLILYYQGGCIYYHHTKMYSKIPSFIGTLDIYNTLYYNTLYYRFGFII